MPRAIARPYHHGQLRRTLLDAAAEEILAVGAARLSLRELARRAGVSHAAPAHHFTDKTGLFTALAAEGFRLLHERTTRQLDRPDALVALGQEYVQFAIEYSAHFAVMFDVSLLDMSDEELARERTVAFDALFRAVAAGTGVTDDGALMEQALAAWVIVHGAATLWLSGNMPYPQDPALVPQLFRELAPALSAIVDASVAQLAGGTAYD